MKILKLGEASHGSDFRVLREHGYPHFLLLLVKTPAYFETETDWTSVRGDAVVLFRPGQKHSYRARGEGYSDCWMHLESPVPLLYEGFPFGTPLYPEDMRRYYALFHLLMDEYFASRGNGAVLEHLGLALVGMLSEAAEEKGGLFGGFLTLRKDIFLSPARVWTAGECAEKLGVSTGYFHTLYKKYFNTTFIADVMGSRVQAAEELLSSCGESVERIAERCGYVCVEHFIRQFKKCTGTTPYQYRKQLR